MSDHELSIGAEHELLLKLEKAGLNEDLARLIINFRHNKMAKVIVRHIGEQIETPDWDIAAEVVGCSNFFGKNDWSVYFPKLVPYDLAIGTLKVPWNMNILQKPAVGRNQMLFYVPSEEEFRPLNLDTWATLLIMEKPSFSTDSNGQMWFINTRFAQTACRPGWHLVSICDREELTLEMSQIYRRASAVELVTACFLNALNNNGSLKFIDGEKIIDTSDRDDGYHVGIQAVSEGRLRVCVGFPKDVGARIAVSRKLPGE